MDDTLFIKYSNIPFENASIKFPVIVGVGLESEFAGEKYLPLYVVGKITAGFIREFESKDGCVRTFNDLNVEGRNLYGLDIFNDYSVNTDSQVIVATGLSTNELNIKQKILTLNKIDLGKRIKLRQRVRSHEKSVNN